MLDRENAIVSAELEIGNEISPIGLAISVAYCAEYPCAVDLIAIVLCIKHTVLCGVVLVDLRILGVNVVDSTLKLTDSRKERCA